MPTQIFKSNLTFFLAALLIVFSIHTISGPDLWFHLHLGRQILNTGIVHPEDGFLLKYPGYQNYHWFFQVLMSGLYSLSLNSISIFFALIWFVIGWRWFRVMRKIDFLGLIAFLSLIVVQRRFEERPEVLSYLFLFFFIRFASEWRAKTDKSNHRKKLLLLLLFLIQLVWVNTHSYFALGLAVLGLELAVYLFHSIFFAPNKINGSTFLPFFIALAASFVSPYGSSALTGISLHWSLLHSEVYQNIAEFRSLGLGSVQDLCFWILWGLTLLGVLSLFTRWRKMKQSLLFFSISLACVGLYLSIQNLRNLPFLVFFAIPLWSHNPFAEHAHRFTDFAKHVQLMIEFLCVAVIFSVITNFYFELYNNPNRFGFGVVEHVYPVRFSKFLQRSGFRGKIFNDPNEGGYLKFYNPSVLFYADTRFASIDSISEYFQALVDGQSFVKIDERLKFDAVIVGIAPSENLVRYLFQSPEWTLSYLDLQHAFFTRKSIGFKSLEPIQFIADDDRKYRLDRKPYPFFKNHWRAFLHTLPETIGRPLDEQALREFSSGAMSGGI